MKKNLVAINKVLLRRTTPSIIKKTCLVDVTLLSGTMKMNNTQNCPPSSLSTSSQVTGWGNGFPHDIMSYNRSLLLSMKNEFLEERAYLKHVYLVASPGELDTPSLWCCLEFKIECPVDGEMTVVRKKETGGVPQLSLTRFRAGVHWYW